MTTYYLTATARIDLLAIGRYTADQWGVAQRNRYIASLYACFDSIMQLPNIGRPCDHIIVKLRYRLQDQHLVFYRELEDGRIEIVRILHKRADVESALSLLS